MPEPSESTGTNEISLWGRLFRSSFHLLYHKLAWSYDLVAWSVSFGQWKAWTRTTLPHLVGERVLELGHGPGHLMLSLAESGFHPVGLDLSPQMGRLARRRLQQSGLALPLIRGCAQRLPFPPGSFDSVVATFPTPYIVDPETLSEIVRVLRPGGRLVIVVGAKLNGQDPLSRFIEWLYWVTGQRQITNGWETPFIQAGLKVQQVRVELNRSQAWLLTAEPIIPGDKD